jgi:hypothetical protein
LIATGALTVRHGLQLMHSGVFVEQNTWFRGTNYSAGTLAAGVFLGLLAFLPPASWISRLMKEKKADSQTHLTYHRRRHGPKKHNV